MTESQDIVKNNNLLSGITPYIYGTTRLGDDNIPFNERVDIALMAMDSEIWFHTSHQYNTALQVLREAFDQNRTKVPKLIIKLGGSTIMEFRNDIYRNLDPLGLENLELGQLCLGGELAYEFTTGGTCYKEFEKLKKEGLVNRFVMEVFPWTSDIPLKALKAGYPEGIVDGYIFYFNPLQRFASNELWNLINEKQLPIIGMRTVSGGPVHRLRDVPGAAWKEYLQKRAVEVAPIFERSGIENWTEFCVRFAFSVNGVKATVGSTSQVKNFQDFLKVRENINPLPKDIVEDIMRLQYRWSDELDIHAEPWSM